MSASLGKKNKMPSDYTRYNCPVRGIMTMSESLEVLNFNPNLKIQWTKADTWEITHFYGRHIKEQKP